MDNNTLSKNVKIEKCLTNMELWVVWYQFCGLRIPHMVVAETKADAITTFKAGGVEYDMVLEVEIHEPTKKYRSCLSTKADIHRIGIVDPNAYRSETIIPASIAAPKKAS